MEFKSTNGKFTVSVPDEVANQKQRNEDQKSDEAIEVNLKCLEEEVNLLDLADTIFNDLFCSTELDLEERAVTCWIINARGEGRCHPLIVSYQVSIDEVLEVIAEQIVL